MSFFITLAENLNIAKALELFYIQQSGLSRILQKLEAELGKKSFQRKNNGLTLTGKRSAVFKGCKEYKKILGIEL